MKLWENYASRCVVYEPESIFNIIPKILQSYQISGTVIQALIKAKQSILIPKILIEEI